MQISTLLLILSNFDRIQVVQFVKKAIVPGIGEDHGATESTIIYHVAKVETVGKQKHCEIQSIIVHIVMKATIRAEPLNLSQWSHLAQCIVVSMYRCS